MTINDRSGPVTPPAVLSGADSVRPMTDAQRLEEERKNLFYRDQLNRDAQASGNLFALLLLLITQAKVDAPADGEKPSEEPTGLGNSAFLGQIAGALGISAQGLSQTVSDVRSGRTSAYEAAGRVHASVDQSKVDWSKAPDVKMGDILRGNKGPTLLNPSLLDAMQKDATLRQRVQWTLDAAATHGLDGKLMANQFWQESGFKTEATSPCNARGIAQFMPATGAKYGLHTEADFRDAKKSIEAGVRHMADLTREHGSQSLALVAYNGGNGAVDFAEKRLGKDVTIGDWMAFMQNERETKGVVGADGKKLNNLWRVQSFEYVTKIDSRYWSPEQYAKAEAKQNSILQQQFAMGGTDQVTPAAGTAAFKATMAKGGVDQVIANAETGALMDRLKAGSKDTLDKKPVL